MRRLLALALSITLFVALAGCSSEDGTRERQPQSDSAEQRTSIPDQVFQETTSTPDGAPQGWEASSWLPPSPGTLDPSMFVSQIDNEYLPFGPGMRWTYEASTEDGTETIDVEVLDETRDVMGIPCVVVRDTVRLEGELVEDTRDWYAQDTAGNVWYMGEDVDNYENGELADHEGAWEAGVDGASPGIKMWADPRVGGTPYYQEYYRGEAEDLGKDITTDGTAEVPLGNYDNVLVVEEWNPMEPDVVERKYYQRGIGVVREEGIKGEDEVAELITFESP